MAKSLLGIHKSKIVCSAAHLSGNKPKIFIQIEWMVWCHGVGMLLYMVLCAHDNSNEEGKPTFLSMSCHPTGPTMATHLLPKVGSHVGIRKGYPPSLTCLDVPVAVIF